MAPVEEHADIRDAVSGVLADLADHDAVRAAAESAEGFSREVWTALTQDVSIAAMTVPEGAGGLGFTLRELAVVLEESGAALLTEPVVVSAVLGARAVSARLAAGEDAALPGVDLTGVLDGSLIITTWLGEGAGAGLQAEERDGGWVLSGVADAVQHANTAGYAVLTAAAGGGEGVFLVSLESDTPSGSQGALGIERQESLDLTRRLSRLRLDEARALRLDDSGGADATVLRQLRTLALAAEHTGMIDRLLTITRGYLLQREQFGRPLASFQALKHRMADLLVDLERARSAARYAAAVFDTAEPGERALAVAIAGSVCLDAVLHTAYEAVQLNGGTGFTWEHPAHYYLRRALGDEALYGSGADRREGIANLVLAGAGQ
ncbi:acyl-CoA/acyl-ACP dehydrogenase [Citricoccus nitrophenolicus]